LRRITSKALDYKGVIFRNKVEDDIAKAMYHSIDVDLVIDKDGKALGDDRVAM